MNSMKRILLVDDEPAMLQTLRIILTSAGHEVDTAWSSKEAMDLVNQERFDLVVTDFNLFPLGLPTREVYVKGPGPIFKGNPKNYLTEIQLPFKD